MKERPLQGVYVPCSNSSGNEQQALWWSGSFQKSFHMLIGCVDGIGSLWRIMAKSSPVMLPENERCYSNKNISLQAVA